MSNEGQSNKYTVIQFKVIGVPTLQRRPGTCAGHFLHIGENCFFFYLALCFLVASFCSQKLIIFYCCLLWFFLNWTFESNQIKEVSNNNILVI